MAGGNGVVRWILTDPVTLDTYEFPINPSDGGSPDYKKNINYVNTAGPSGNVLMFEGRDAPKQYTVTGTILEQSHYEAMITWFNKRYQLTLTDDLGRSFEIYITGFTPRRVRSALYPYKHAYTMAYTELDW